MNNHKNTTKRFMNIGEFFFYKKKRKKKVKYLPTQNRFTSNLEF